MPPNMYVLPYIFVCQLSSADDSENGRKYEVRCGGCCWWPCAAVVAIGWAVAEIEEVDGGGTLVRSPEERYRGGATVPSRHQ